MSYSHIRTTKPRARKDHPCIWCPELIAKGTVHVLVVGKYEGELQHSRYHQECNDACAKFLRDNRTDEFNPHEFKRGTTEEA